MEKKLEDTWRLPRATLPRA